MTITSKEGDTVTQENGETIVITPPSTDHNFNFGPASLKDVLVYTCERPGGDPNLHHHDNDTNDNDDSKTIPKKISTMKAVAEWMDFMTHLDRQIQHVIILLSNEELDEGYDPPGLIPAYEDVSTKLKDEKGIEFHIHHVHFTPSSHEETMLKLDSIIERNEKVVVHCTHGMGRSGRVAAAWLVHKYGVAEEEATEIVLNVAREHSVQRMGAVEKLQKWIEYDG